MKTLDLIAKVKELNGVDHRHLEGIESSYRKGYIVERTALVQLAKLCLKHPASLVLVAQRLREAGEHYVKASANARPWIPAYGGSVRTKY